MFTIVGLVTLGVSEQGYAQQQVGTSNEQTVEAGTQQQQATSGADAAAIYGMATGEERFLRENRDPGQMVGTPTTGIGATRGSADATGQSGRTSQSRSPFSQFGRMFDNQLRNMMWGQYNTRHALRIPVRLGFAPTTRPDSSAISARVQSRLERIPRVREMGSVSVKMDGTVAVLSGEVSTERDRELISRILLFEPGISDVRNELQVASAAAESSSPSDKDPR